MGTFKKKNSILLYLALSGKANVPTDDFIPLARCNKNHDSLCATARKEIYKRSFLKIVSFPQMKALKLVLLSFVRQNASVLTSLQVYSFP